MSRLLACKDVKRTLGLCIEMLVAFSNINAFAIIGSSGSLKRYYQLDNHEWLYAVQKRFKVPQQFELSFSGTVQSFLLLLSQLQLGA